MPDVKQLYFFEKDFNAYRAKTLAQHKTNNSYNFTKESYLENFEGSENFLAVGDLTPSYILSRVAATEIYKFNKDAKIIIILREPRSFLRSFHNQLINSKIESQLDFSRALKLEKYRKENVSSYRGVEPPELLYYSDNIDYISHIKRFTEVFPKANIKVLVYEDFVRDNLSFLNEILSFIGVPSVSKLTLKRSNESVRYNSLALVLDGVFRNQITYLVARTFFTSEFRRALGKKFRKVISSDFIGKWGRSMIKPQAISQPSYSVENKLLEQYLKDLGLLPKGYPLQDRWR